MDIIKYKGLAIDPSKINESMTVKVTKPNVLSLNESFAESTYVMPRIEAIHAGATANHVYYPADKLKGDAAKGTGVHSWISPYPKPVIYNHDVNTESTGRIQRAAFSEYTHAGKPGIIVVPKITDPKAVQSIKDGRLLTVSIGATTDSCTCSVCGTDIINEGYCGHMKGEVYDGVVAQWIVGDIIFNELSWVNVPADENAFITDIESNYFMDGPEEAKDSASDKSVHEFYQIPMGISLVEAIQKETDNQTKEDNVLPTENPEIGTDDVTVEEPVVTPEEPAVTKEEPVVADEPVVIDEPEVGENTEPSAENPAAPVEPEIPAQPEGNPEAGVKESASESALEIMTKALASAKAVNENLSAQVDALTERLRAVYKQNILESIQMEEAEKEKFVDRLEKRSLESLEETLQDIQDGFFASKSAVKKEDSQPRQAVQISNPVKESDSAPTKHVLNEADKVNIFAQLFNPNK